MSEGPASALIETRRPWLERLDCILIMSWVLLSLALVCQSLCRNSLDSTTDHWIQGALVHAALVGVFHFVFLIMLPGLLIYGIALRWSRKIGLRLVMALAALVISFNLWEAVSWRLIACEPARFADITSMKWPETSKCVKALHGFGFQDRRHLWVFEGTPEEFQRHKTQLPWGGGAATVDRMANIGAQRLPMAEVESAFRPETPWKPTEVYNWMFEKDSEPPAPGVWGPAWMFVNARHTQWCVWWDGI